MNDEPSLLPWRVADGMQETIVDDHNNIVANASNNATAALIVDAVNERDRLRDIVRRIETEMERCHRRDGGISQELIDAVYEARAAIGEYKE